MRNAGLMTMAGCAVGVLVLTACGQTAPDAGTAAPGAGAADGLPACETAEVLRAPEGDYRDEPVYVGNDQPVEQVQAWALDLPGFAGVWIDRERNGWVTVAFTEDVDQRRAEAAEQFPDEGVAVVAAEHTEAELTALADRIHTETPEGVLLSSGWRSTAGGVGGGDGAHRGEPHGAGAVRD
ncbi:hypothetical protein [Ruania alba]|uniref:Uncharacterized protein n=1 Tax=Ruania alba TaxID=648782 RepID=A0A1H5MKX5_9MICO|nr:hypothetical protein [Ruania alba]SEE89873.1 hypothetical protein SAMN04488554_3462 [Ruania alba]